MTAAKPDPLRFVREDLNSLTYKPVKPLDALAAELGLPEDSLVKLDANENLHVLPTALRQSLETACLNIYPDPMQGLLRAALAEYHDVSEAQIVAGAGSDDLLDILIRLVDTPAIAICPPTFGMYSFLSKIAKVGVVEVARRDDFSVDVPAVVSAIREKGIKLLFLPSPNNPTGNLVPNADVATLCAEDCLVVMDEAYTDFAGESAASLLPEWPNLVVLRTFSKWAGLAGLRIGYALAHEALVARMMAIKQPYNVNSAADAAARAALAHRTEIEVSIRAIVQERNRLLAELPKFPFLKPLPSDSNFVLCRVEGASAEAVSMLLRHRGILIRFFGTQGGNLSNYIRVSAGRPCDTDRLLAALREVEVELGQGAPLVSKLNPVDKAALLFDMDGVLADVANSYRSCIVQTAAEFGATVTRGMISAAKARGNANNDWVLTHALIQEHSTQEPKPSLEQVTESFEKLYQGTETTPGLRLTESLIVKPWLLRMLADKFTLGIVTGRPLRDAETFLREHNIAEFFKAIASMEDRPPKPDPAPVHAALSRLGLSHGFLVGDTVDDIRAAKAAGIVAVGVPAPGDTSSHDTLAASGAEFVFTPGLTQLAALLS